jgi:hypothetical protein
MNSIITISDLQNTVEGLLGIELQVLSSAILVTELEVCRALKLEIWPTRFCRTGSLISELQEYKVWAVWYLTSKSIELSEQLGIRNSGVLNLVSVVPDLEA